MYYLNVTPRVQHSSQRSRFDTPQQDPPPTYLARRKSRETLALHPWVKSVLKTCQGVGLWAHATFTILRAKSIRLIDLRKLIMNIQWQNNLLQYEFIMQWQLHRKKTSNEISMYLTGLSAINCISDLLYFIVIVEYLCVCDCHLVTGTFTTMPASDVRTLRD